MTYPRTRSKFWPSSRNLKPASGWKEWERGNEEDGTFGSKRRSFKRSKISGERRGIDYAAWKAGRHSHRFRIRGRLVRLPAGERSTIPPANRIRENEPALRPGRCVARR